MDGSMFIGTWWSLVPPLLYQSVRYPTGCESVTAVMLLRYLGYPVTVDEFIQNYLELEEFEEIDGEQYGYDEEGYYFNDPYENNGVIRYPKAVVEDRHRAQHSQAVGVKKPFAPIS